MNSLKLCDPQIRLCLFILRPLAFINLSTICVETETASDHCVLTGLTELCRSKIAFVEFLYPQNKKIIGE